jgi:hypothetical protein
MSPMGLMTIFYCLMALGAWKTTLLPSNGHLFLFHCSGFQLSCYYICVYEHGQNYLKVTMYVVVLPGRLFDDSNCIVCKRRHETWPLYIRFWASQVCSGCDRYLRPAADAQQQPTCGDSPPDPNTTSSGDECSTSAATSGEEVWGTPTSGGELDEELVFPSAVSVSISARWTTSILRRSVTMATLWFSKVPVKFQFLTITPLNMFLVISIFVTMLLTKAWGILRLWTSGTASKYGWHLWIYWISSYGEGKTGGLTAWCLGRA